MYGEDELMGPISDGTPIEKHERPIESGAPRVAIFWVVKGQLIIDSVPLARAEPWGDRYLNDPRSHMDTWEHYKALRAVPVTADWADYPRGRVIYDKVTERFRIYADLCILNDPETMARIKSVLNLPLNTPAGRDDHYCCEACMGRDEGPSLG